MSEDKKNIKIEEKELEYELGKLEDELELFEDNLNSIEEDKNNYNQQEHNDKTKSGLAKVFVYGYFLMIGLSMFSILIYNYLIFRIKNDNELIIDVKELLLVITTAIGSPLGFIIGYYFKENSI
jgi:hypothetical protein